MTEKVFAQILRIRSGGSVNMLDVNAVHRVAFSNEMDELVCYIEDDQKRYFNFIMTGRLPEGEDNPRKS